MNSAPNPSPTIATRTRLASARLDALVAATSDVVYLMTADWSEMQPLNGRGLVTGNDAPIRDWMERNLPADEHPRVKAAIADAIASKQIFELEHRVNGPDGREQWTYSRAVPILDDDLYENDEHFDLRLDAACAFTPCALLRADGRGTIANDDAPEPGREIFGDGFDDD